jgi:hypothetical protein
MIKPLLKLAFKVGLSTTYGFSEYNCGDIGKPRPCIKGAITASGIELDPDKPQAAIFAPTKMILRPKWINGNCVRIHLVDKGNPRYIGKRAFDLTPEAVRLLTGRPATPYWSAKLYPCKVRSDPYWERPIDVNPELQRIFNGYSFRNAY